MMSPEALNRRGATWPELDGWIGHQASGDWFTSRLLDLWQRADANNRARFKKGFPTEARIFEAWYFSEDLAPIGEET